MRILILQDEPSAFSALRKSLESHHELVMATTVDRAMQALHSQHIDLIVSRMHLGTENVFDFLTRVKEDQCLRHIPFICFCGRLNKYASKLDSVMAKLGLINGADKYFSLHEFCRGGVCDYEALRHSIENVVQTCKNDNLFTAFSASRSK